MMAALYVSIMSWLSQPTKETRSFYQANDPNQLVALIIIHSQYYFVYENTQCKDFHFVYMSYGALNVELCTLEIWGSCDKD